MPSVVIWSAVSCGSGNAAAFFRCRDCRCNSQSVARSMARRQGEGGQGIIMQGEERTGGKRGVVAWSRIPPEIRRFCLVLVHRVCGLPRSAWSLNQALDLNVRSDSPIGSSDRSTAPVELETDMVLGLRVHNNNVSSCLTKPHHTVGLSKLTFRTEPYRWPRVLKIK